VAHVRDGNRPQTNIVHVDGSRSVLMMVLKAGSVSTLDIIDGIKKKIVEVKDALPETLKVGFIGDQSIFVRNAIAGVAFEGLLAAALTSIMILLFLGSWRSTLIIAVSIPLSVMGAIVCLALVGETLNIMTLGGLALAVGILVDDATVTIENINWHLEHGKDVEPAILDGARQIVTPAFVSLLCICIVFVPMFFLTGVSRFLFVPMAEAVMFAMIWSFILSRTLVPTMAKYLLHKHAHDEHGNPAEKPPTRNPLVRFQRGFEAGFARLRDTYRDLLPWPRPPQGVHHLLPRLRRGLVPAGAVPRAQLLPGGRHRPDPDARAPRSAPASRDRHRLADIQRRSARSSRGRDRHHGRQHRHAISGINMTYNNTG